MFKQKMGIAAVLATATTFATGAAFAEVANPARQASINIEKFSVQGHAAFQEIALARLAIFDGHPGQAKKLVHGAQQALARAQTDDTAFTAAEADLKALPSTSSQPSVSQNATPLAWLPVDGRIVLTDDYTASSAKLAAIAAANMHLKKGERNEAIRELRLADINVAYTMVVAPLKQTVVDVDKAAGLLSLDKYYEADQTLAQVEKSLRIEWMDENAAVKTSSK